MTDPTQPGQPSEEELRAYLEQLRTADPTEVVVQAYRMLGTGAEVKLGRPDARVLIDALGGLVQAVEGHLDGELVGQMRDGVGQLQTAQVQAERESAAQAAPGDAGARGQEGQGAPGGGQQAAAAGQPPAGEQRTGQQQGTAGQRMTDRLWVPGRDPGPR